MTLCHACPYPDTCLHFDRCVFQSTQGEDASIPDTNLRILEMWIRNTDDKQQGATAEQVSNWRKVLTAAIRGKVQP